MKVGDLVMFVDDGTYAKWFWGQMGVVERCNYSSDGKLYVRVSWLLPVSYHGKMTLVSDFSADKFQLCHEVDTDNGELTDGQLEQVAGGMSSEKFSEWRTKKINERG